MPLLPPPKPTFDPADEAAIVNYADGLVFQSREVAEPHFTQVARNYNLYLGNHWLEVAPDETAARYVYNRIQTILISHAAIQNGQRAKVTILPRKSQRRGLCFIRNDVYQNFLPSLEYTPDLQALFAAIPPECLALPPETPAPLPRKVYEALQKKIDEGKAMSEMAMMQRLPAPIVLPPDLIIEINDATATKALQTLFDTQWEACNADFHVLSDSVQNAVCGWNHMRYRWDHAAQRHYLHNCEYCQVFLDQTRPDIRQSPTALQDEILTEEDALAYYPEFREAIKANFQMGVPMPAGAYYKRAAIYEGKQFRVNMGTIRWVWVRNQPYPMTEEEAIARGLVVRGLPYQPPVQEVKNGEVSEENIGAGGDDSGAGRGDGLAGIPGERGGSVDRGASLDVDGLGPGLRNDSVDIGEGESPDLANPERGDAAGGGELAEAPGGLANSPAQPSGPVPAQPTALLLVKGDPSAGVPPMGEVKFWGPGWPMRRGIREIAIIGQRVQLDHECPDAEIPLTHNVNIPQLYGPLGQGTPEALELLNMAINEMLSDLVHHVRKEAFETTIVSEELQKSNPDIALEAFARPGTALTGPHDRMAELDKLIQNVKPPQASADLWRFLVQLLELIDKQGDMANVLQGNADASWSGQAIGRLQGAAQNSILFRSKRAEFMLKYLAQLMIGGLMRMDIAAIEGQVPEYTGYVWKALMEWAKTGLKYDLSIEIANGGGLAKQQKAADMRAARREGLEVSPQSIMEAMDLDPEEQRHNNLQWAAESQAMMSAVQQPQPASAPQQGV